MRSPDRVHAGESRSEREKTLRLETYFYFIRHGTAEKLPGMHTDGAVDRQRRLTPKGEGQAERAGEFLDNDIRLESGDMIFFRESPGVRSQQTVRHAREIFLRRQQERGEVNVFAPTTEVGKRREALIFPNEMSFQTYELGGKRRSEKGGTDGLCEEWARHPEILQADMEASGLMGKNAEIVLGQQRGEFQNILSTVERASHVFRHRWDNLELPPDTRRPRLIVLVGSHGAVSEPWLREAVRAYEEEKNVQVPLELDKGGVWKLHIPENPAETATLTIGGHAIPIAEQFFRKINTTL